MLLIAASDGQGTKSECGSSRCVHIDWRQESVSALQAQQQLPQTEIKHNDTIDTPFDTPPRFTGCRVYEARYQKVDSMGEWDRGERSISLPWR